MKKALMAFADGLLSKEQMKKVRGGCGSGGAGCPTFFCAGGSGGKILCSYSVYYGGGSTVHGLGPCARATVDACNSNLVQDVMMNHPGAYSAQGYGCYSVGM